MRLLWSKSSSSGSVHQKTSHVPYELRSPNYHTISAQYGTSYLRKGLICPFYKLVGPIPAVLGPGSNIYVRSQIKMSDQQNLRWDLTSDTTLKCPIPHWEVILKCPITSKMWHQIIYFEWWDFLLCSSKYNSCQSGTHMSENWLLIATQRANNSKSKLNRNDKKNRARQNSGIFVFQF